MPGFRFHGSAGYRLHRLAPLGVRPGHARGAPGDLRTEETGSRGGPGPLRRALARELRAASAFAEEVTQLCLDHFGEAPWPGDDGDAGWLVARPSHNDLAAWEAFAHLGVRRPPALALRHLWVYRRGEGALHALPRSRRARARSFPFEGALTAIAAAEKGVVVIEEVGPELCRWWAVNEEGEPALQGEVGLLAAAVREARVLDDGLLVHAGTPLGGLLLRLRTGGASGLR